MQNEARTANFGDLAVESGFLSKQELADGLRMQRRLRVIGLDESLGEILLQKGVLNPDQTREILRIQGEREARRIPGYHIERKLGAGKMGEVFMARQLSDDRKVALKILSRAVAAREKSRLRFLREGRLASRLDHPHIVRAYDVGVAGDEHYIVLEYVQGPNLRQILLEAGTLGERRALSIMMQIAGALEHAEENQIVHRDVKPANILIEEATGDAKLADLGLAKPWSQGGSNITRARTVVGTPFYISPEQARGQSRIDSRADVYCLAASLFHVLTGEPLFGGETGGAILARHATEDPRPIREVRDEISTGLEELLLHCLSKNPEDRPSPRDVAESAEDLREEIAARR